MSFRITGLHLRSKALDYLQQKEFPNVKHLAVIDAINTHPPNLVFSNAESLFFNARCDKNTNYYWGLNIKDYAPNVKQVMMAGHPCDRPVVRALLERTPRYKLFISQNQLALWARYAGYRDFMDEFSPHPGYVEIRPAAWFEAKEKEYRDLIKVDE